MAAVLGYYARFLEAFPSLEALAAAPEDRLMKLWEGLGYYSRARNLQKTARIVAEQYGGRFPASYAALLELPGIGDYTASAIASAAFGLREPAVDGNALRVVSRLTDSRGDITAPAVKAAVRTLLGEAMPRASAEIRIFNQAVMELGATVCAPGGPPACGRCPVRGICLGWARGTAELLPVRAAKKPRRAEEKTVFLLLRDGCAALRQRPKEGLLAGLWEFPNVPGALNETDAASAAAAWGLEIVSWSEKLTARHIFTHVEWHMTGYVLRVRGRGPAEFLWADRAELARRAIPSAFAKYTSAAVRELSTPENREESR